LKALCFPSGGLFSRCMVDTVEVPIMRIAIVLLPEEFGRLVDVAQREHRRASDQVHHWIAEQLARSAQEVPTSRQPTERNNEERPPAVIR
jgi:hypothetical protein